MSWRIDIKPGTKTCPSCGKPFRCEGEQDCWCESYPIHRKDMVRLMRDYDDCLCPECLREYAGE